MNPQTCGYRASRRAVTWSGGPPHGALLVSKRVSRRLRTPNLQPHSAHATYQSDGPDGAVDAPPCNDVAAVS